MPTSLTSKPLVVDFAALSTFASSPKWFCLTFRTLGRRGSFSRTVQNNLSARPPASLHKLTSGARRERSPGRNKRPHCRCASRRLVFAHPRSSALSVRGQVAFDARKLPLIVGRWCCRSVLQSRAFWSFFLCGKVALMASDRKIGPIAGELYFLGVKGLKLIFGPIYYCKNLHRRQGSRLFWAVFVKSLFMTIIEDKLPNHKSCKHNV